ncbi:growth/differentiation factor 9 isoform X1 [Ochotona curzoniae]|uniref:growth/differentiation factor 9 isoform X1 n=1 Tax=Ochotona curzoniae TaxID=130825 RepID=UPI001B34D7ED|nr:growth/differentiation factor 9 isoform X1 [Ochotona curzoniae]
MAPPPRRFLPWFCCFACVCFPISSDSQPPRGAPWVAANAASESVAEPWSLLQPVGGGEHSGLLPPLFRVLSVRRGAAPRLQPDSSALHYMKKLYKAYATKEGIPKANRRHLYNTVRLFTPWVQQKAPGHQVTGLPQWALSVDVLFKLDRVTAVELPVKSVLLYTLTSVVSSTVRCTCSLLVREPRPSGKTLRPLTLNSQFEFRKKYKWAEIDVTPLLQPLMASSERHVHLSGNCTCVAAQQQHPAAREGPLNMTVLASPSLILYLNDTSAQAHHPWYSLPYKSKPSQGLHQQGMPARPTGGQAARVGRSLRQPTGPRLKQPPAPASLNLSEYFKKFVFPQNECELHDFRLSFSQLKWHNWIVAPHRYNPRYCKGDCPRAVGHRYGSPVHTMVQNIIYEKLDSSVPRPSCVPARYSPLSVLTIEPDSSIAYKEYEDMIATKCTCR